MLMRLKGFEYRGYKCFKGEWSGIRNLSNINLIVGPNNAGKSHFIEMTQKIIRCDRSFPSLGLPLTIICHLTFDELASAAPESYLRNGLEADQQEEFRHKGINMSFTWNAGAQFLTYEVEKCSFLGERQPAIEEIIKTYVKMSPPVHARIEHEILNVPVRTISAARYLTPEVVSKDADPEQSLGRIRRLYLQEHGEDQAVFRKLKHKFLRILNDILQEQVPFTDLTFKDAGKEKITLSLVNEFSDEWNVMFMGSGVRELILIIFEFVFNDGETVQRETSTLFIEEPENNLHPAAQRRLARFLHHHALEHNEFLFISTHSSTILSEFISLGSCSVTRVEKNSLTSLATSVDPTSILDLHQTTQALGSTPGDLFMANGVIWVEGPSDRLYISHWINLFRQNSGLPTLLEGHHYTFAFLGGVNAAHHSASFDDHAEFGRLIVCRINPKFFFILDKDRDEDKTLKNHVIRLQKECTDSGIDPSPIWITDYREIENYLPIEAWQKAYPIHSKAEVDNPKTSHLWASKAKGGWVATFLDKKNPPKKMTVAEAVCAETTWEMMSCDERWIEKMTALMKAIDAWNT